MATTPVMELDSLQIIPAPWDTTTNQFVPTTFFSTFFYVPSSPTNSHAWVHTHTCKAQSILKYLAIYLCQGSQLSIIKWKYKSYLENLQLQKCPYIFVESIEMVKLKHKEYNLKCILASWCSKKNLYDTIFS